MRNSTKMGGSIKKKYQVGGLKKMNPAKISVPGSSKKLTPAQQKKYFDKLRKETEKQLRNSPMFPTPKKRKGGVIVASPIQGRTGRRGAAGSNMAKGGQKFPDLTGDGKVTKKDILRGRGVLKYGGRKRYKYGYGGGPGDPPASGSTGETGVTGETGATGEKGATAPAPAPALGFYDLAMQAAQSGPRGARVALRNARKMEEAKATGTRRGANVGSALTGAGAALTGAGNVINAVKPGPTITTPAGGMKRGGQKHPGFKAVQSKIAAKQGVSKKAAGAILAASTRKASAKAKAANPRLKRVKR